ncbi:hypothetical protein HPP92_008236 [Vanilla planifolia]|uniref:Uncharacterized protein n=1 Tax=Vanilla planifolia TaxID=51239 RepID=A0A835R5M8_VANPL|nr:hypothetical protein HPP92_027996 [Vanilla planifolia]KAG0486141.1 hypothetical protein HPP92_008236 [Vanilla planifolia]
MSLAETSGAGSGGKIRKPRSRLRMHAPSSIQVDRPSGSVAEWKAAIPFLSPLDIVSMPLMADPRPTEAEGKKAREVEGEAAGEKEGVGEWRHPAEPFFYEPIPANAPAFTAPHWA